MKPVPFEYHRAGSVEEAVSLLARFGADARILAGGLSLVPALNLRHVRPSHVVDINGIADLDYVEAVDGWLRIGALARHAAFCAPPVDGPLGGLLPLMARFIGHDPIRRRGTFVGTIVQQSPAAEWCLLCHLLQARIVIVGTGGERIETVGASSGDSLVKLDPCDVVVEVRLPILGDDWTSGFREFAPRSNDPALGMALALLRTRGGRIEEARLGIAGIDTPWRRLANTEQALIGDMLAGEARIGLTDIARADVDVPGRSEHGAAYRAHLLSRLAVGAVADCAAGGGGR